MANEKKELVYQHRGKTATTSPLVNNGLAVTSVSALETILKEHPEIQATRKPLPRGQMSLEIYECDLLTESQKTQHAGMPNYEANVAGVKVPFGALLQHLVDASKFEELVILSAKR